MAESRHGLPAELEARLEAIEAAHDRGADFDGVSWWWLALLGAVLPMLLIVLGW